MDVVEGVPAPGSGIRHYRVLASVSRGGPGFVLACYDPRLERRVDLRGIDLEQVGGEAGANRVLAGLGRAAALHDASLIPIHDGWLQGGRLFVVTEHVEAPTLADLRLGGPLAAERACGLARGIVDALAALGRVGLAHGNLRPVHVHVLTGDEVRLRDFGLDPTAGDEGASVFARDQSALCRLLTGLVAAGERDLAQLPAWLNTIVRRGTDEHPERRFPSPGSLRDALERTPSRRRRRVGAGFALAVGVFTTVLVVREAGRSTTQVCGGEELRLQGVWDAEREAAVQAAFDRSRLPFAGETAKYVQSSLGRYVARWARARTAACEATHVDGVQSEGLLDRRMSCLDQHLRELDAVAGMLASADDGVIERAAEMVDELAPVSACSDLDELGAELFLPTQAATREAMVEIQAALASVRAQRSAGRYAPALQRVTELEAEARSLEQPALLTEVSHLRGDLLAKTGDPDRATAVLRDAVHAAWLGGRDREAASAWTLIAFVEGDLRAAHDEAELALGHARAAIDRMGEDEELAAELLSIEGVLRIDQGRYPEAVDTFNAALALREGFADPDSPRLGSDYNNLANALTRLARYDEALAAYGRARAIWAPSLGTSHPDIASLHNNLGALAYSRGDLDGAEREFKGAYALRREVLGESHPQVGEVVDNLGVLAAARGRHEEALGHYRRALAIHTAVHGPDHPAVADSVLNVGTSLQASGDAESALEHYRQALSIYRRSLGEEHPWTALAVHNEARALRDLGRLGEAIRGHRRALEIRRAVYGDGHPMVAPSHRALGECLLEAGEIVSAVEQLRLGVVALEADAAADPADLEGARAALAAAQGRLVAG